MSKYLNLDDYCANLCKCNSSECDKSKCRLWQAANADVIEVVRCANCRWWKKYKGGIQGRCKLHEISPSGKWYCANGKREE